eukprot:TRINITY_DN583_c0_g1_i1.p2 TRINITY_DN583_c0_g1~~TRINITY_DN583_c0_g1_i1.p2  ORF type:complete len:339 (+),score=75.18 TRINITY_DN583_c0_g1_i1:325-1341(+)
MVLPLLFLEATEQDLIEKYAVLKENKYYKELLETGIPVIGTWDDHDFGMNDGGEDVSIKEKSKEHILKFLDVPKDAEQFQHDGIYASYEYGPPGQKIKFILLDVRYFRKSDDVLGPAQWAWLENQLNNSDAQLNFIVSGSQVIGVDAFYRETWDVQSLEKLYSLIAQSKASGIMLLTGDVHYSEILKNDCRKFNYPIYEFTSSGMTHSVENIPFVSTLATNTYSRWSLIGQTGKNFGTIEVSWDSEEPLVSIQSRTPETGAILFQRQFLLRDVQYNATRERHNEAACFRDEDLGIFGWKKIPKPITTSFFLSSFAAIFVLVIYRLFFKKPNKPVQKDD